MGDPTHLERLGRELNCPVCLSLLNSAVSLTCNHVFCNSCIMKSMKSAASCPVCKVPFHRREVRPAPNMDSLVSIYKSMESASGLNIFVSQNVPDTKVLDGHTQVTPDGNVNPKFSNQTETKQLLIEKRIQDDKNNSQFTSVKPSFPAKKRVQVPHSPLAESPFQCEKFRTGPCESIKEGPQNEPATLIETPLCEGKGDRLSPFFWLREEDDAEDLSERSSGDRSTDTSTRLAPSFSEIMDFNDEVCPETAPSGQLHEKPVVDVFSNEMFEWTQKPCSPELFSSPFKMQEVDTVDIDRNHEKFRTAESNFLDSNHAGKNLECENFKDESIDAIMLPSMSSVGIIDSDYQPMGLGSRKRARKGTVKQVKCTEKDPAAYTIDSTKLALVDNQQYAINENSRTKPGAHVNAMKPKSENVTALANKEEATNNGIGNCETGKLYMEKPVTMKKAGRYQRKACALRILEGQKDSVESNPVKRKSMSTQAQTNQKSGFGLSSSFVPLAGSEKEVDINQRPSRKYKSCGKKIKSIKKLEVALSTSKEKETESVEKIQSNFDVCTLDNSSTSKNCFPLGEVVLRKCEIHPTNYDCAFCLSSTESEVHGEMVHYCDGKPVAADYNGVTKVIHSHRYCAEWAPNVYFEDDNAINLEAELSRSKRLKCSLCGLTGAALGCYEKSCRRSFHVPCAKLTPRCRWDEDNFVILCPVHSYAKLPCEKIVQQKNRERCRPQVQTNQKCDNLPGEHDSNKKQILRTPWLGKKIVICCSGLTIPERNVVSEFEKLSKVSILKKWDSSVTHVIASTDENGACRRTLKTLLGILEGKWILTVDWIRVCIKTMKPVDEEPYEISVDIHGIRDGPRLGRLRVFSKQPKIFEGLKFYLMRDFISSYKAYLRDLVIAAGGMILHRKPVTEEINAPSSDNFTSKIYIIYSLELPDKCDPSKKEEIFSQRKNDAAALAKLTGTKFASNLWILNCIAACKLETATE